MLNWIYVSILRTQRRILRIFLHFTNPLSSKNPLVNTDILFQLGGSYNFSTQKIESACCLFLCWLMLNRVQEIEKKKRFSYTRRGSYFTSKYIYDRIKRDLKGKKDKLIRILVNQKTMDLLDMNFRFILSYFKRIIPLFSAC